MQRGADIFFNLRMLIRKRAVVRHGNKTFHHQDKTLLYPYWMSFFYNSNSLLAIKLCMYECTISKTMNQRFRLKVSFQTIAERIGTWNV